VRANELRGKEGEREVYRETELVCVYVLVSVLKKYVCAFACVHVCLYEMSWTQHSSIVPKTPGC
jgi:hypothetical protein